jgi:hypothetical protein
MPKKPKSTSESAYQEQELETERVYRTTLLCRYLQVTHRHGDALELSPKPGCRISFVHYVGEGGRITRIVLAPAVAAKGQK